MQDISDQVYKMMQLLSLIQIKCSDSKNKNIQNINNEINGYNKQDKL
jgi:hypothetical protein